MGDSLGLLGDLRLAARRILKAPAASAAAVLTLGLALGATSALFGVVYAVLLKPLPIRDPGRLVVVWEQGRSAGEGISELSHRNFRDWSAGAREFTHLAAMGSSNWSEVLDHRGEAVRLSYTAVTESFFDTLGAPPLLGRTFRREDDLTGAPPVVVLSHGTWTRRFGADPSIVGKAIRLGDQARTVVGVMPRGFDFPRGAELWMPVVPVLAAASVQWKTDTLAQVGVLFAVGRLREGVSLPRARDELDALARHHQSDSAPRFGAAVVVTPFLDYLLGPVRPALGAVFAAVGTLLLIACANVSGLLLTRAALRRREDAIRLALGATRSGLGRPWVAETLLLALAGGALGLALSSVIARAVVALAPGDVPRIAEVAIDLRVVAFTFVLILATALLCAAAPVRQAAARDLLEALHEGAHGAGGKKSLRARSVLLTLQVGLAVTLLLTAGLVVRSFTNLRTVDLGFAPGGVLTLSVDPRDLGRPPNPWFQDLLREVNGMPGVVAAGAVSLRPLALGAVGSGTWVVLEGQPETSEGGKGNPTLNYLVATPGYFRAMRIDLVRGRLFDDGDDARAPRVAIVSESTARRLWPGQDPLGRRLLMPTHDAEKPGSAWRTVVGVVRDVRYRGLEQAILDVYDPGLQASAPTGDLLVRTSRDPLALLAAVQAAARNLHPRVVLDGATTMDAVVSRALAPWRLGAWMLSAFAGLAFVLAALGLYSLVSLEVAQRRREFAIRLALGARRSDILDGVLRRAGGWVVLGGTLGLALAWAGARGVRSLLFAVDALDPLTYVAVFGLVASVVAVASFLPARRAAGADPLSLLRRD